MFTSQNFISLIVKGDQKKFRQLMELTSDDLLCFAIGFLKNKEVAEALHLNEKTISTYKLRLLAKLNVTNLVDLVNKAKTLEIV